MEPQLKVEKTKSEWITCSYGYDPKVTVFIRVENGEMPHDAKIGGLRGDSETTYIKFGILQKLFQALLPFLQEVRVAQERTRPPEESNE